MVPGGQRGAGTEIPGGDSAVCEPGTRVRSPLRISAGEGVQSAGDDEDYPDQEGKVRGLSDLPGLPPVLC